MSLRETGFFDRLGSELSQAVRRDLVRRSRRRRRILQFSLAGAMVAVVVVGLVRSPSAVAGIEIERSGSYFTVRLVDVETDPGGVERALKDAGIDAKVTAVAAAPSKVGKFVMLAQQDFSGEPVEWVDVTDGAAAGLKIPADTSGTLRLFLGRKAWPWESYDAPASAYAPGEPLYCSDLWGTPVGDASDTLDQIGVRVRWESVTLSGAIPVDDPTTIADLFVTDAVSTRRGEVLIDASPTPESLFRTPPPPPCG